MGTFLSKHFFCGWEKVGTFTVVKSGERVVQKQGGNVATYFCTPDLEVIHAVAGNVGAEEFLREAKWAVDLAGRFAGKSNEERLQVAKEAHGKRLQEMSGGWENGLRRGGMVQYSLGRVATASTVTTMNLGVDWGTVQLVLTEGTKVTGTATANYVPRVVESGIVLHGTANGDGWTTNIVNLGWVAQPNGWTVHQKLGDRPLPSLKEIFREIFEGILGEVVSDQDVTVLETPELRCRRIRLVDTRLQLGRLGNVNR